MMGLDADYGMSRAYSAQSWPSFVVVGVDGIVRFHGFDPDRNLGNVRRILEELATAGAAPKATVKDGIAFPEEVLACRRAVRERSPRLAFDKAGNPNMVYYSNREGTNAVYWRCYDNKGHLVKEERLSPMHGESYAADCAFDSEGTLWATWCGREEGKFNIFVQSRPRGGKQTTRQLTMSDDDAMSPKIAIGSGGKVTVTYYKWAMLWGYSRDRNIFARTYDPSQRVWLEELEISPNVPEVEDHTDPDVVVDGQGRSWVAWSYDYHPQLYKKPLPAEQPTIFAARVSSKIVSAPLLVGATGEFRDAIDLFPSAAIDGEGALWCAWDCSEPRRCIRLARLNPAGDKFSLVSTFGRNQDVCSTPELSPAGTNLLLLAWSERAAGEPWRARVALLKAGIPVGNTTVSEPMDVQFPQALQAPGGEYWLVYEKGDAKGSEAMLRNVTRELGL